MRWLLILALLQQLPGPVALPGPLKLGQAQNNIGGGGTTVIYGSNFGAGAPGVTWNTTPTAGKGVVYYAWGSVGFALAGSAVCDGTGAGGCTGSSTYTCEAVYANASNYQTVACFTCNVVGTSGQITATPSSGSLTDAVAISMSGQTSTSTNCLGGYNKAQ